MLAAAKPRRRGTDALLSYAAKASLIQQQNPSSHHETEFPSGTGTCSGPVTGLCWTAALAAVVSLVRW
jgi:hypothetical protein